MRLGRCCASWRAAARIATSDARARWCPRSSCTASTIASCASTSRTPRRCATRARRRGAPWRRARAAARGSRPPRRGRRGVAGCEDGAMAGGAPGTAGPGNGSGLLGEPVREFVDDLTSVLGALRTRAGAPADAVAHRARRRTRGPGRRRGHHRRRRPPERRRAAGLRRGARTVVRVAPRRDTLDAPRQRRDPPAPRLPDHAVAVVRDDRECRRAATARHTAGTTTRRRCGSRTPCARSTRRRRARSSSPSTRCGR